MVYDARLSAGLPQSPSQRLETHRCNALSCQEIELDVAHHRGDAARDDHFHIVLAEPDSIQPSVSSLDGLEGGFLIALLHQNIGELMDGQVAIRPNVKRRIGIDQAVGAASDQHALDSAVASPRGAWKDLRQQGHDLCRDAEHLAHSMGIRDIAFCLHIHGLGVSSHSSVSRQRRAVALQNLSCTANRRVDRLDSAGFHQPRRLASDSICAVVVHVPSRFGGERQSIDAHHRTRFVAGAASARRSARRHRPSVMNNSGYDVAMLQLTPTESRVLGVLIEKAQTTPQQYPLTLNALVSGCNQKNNREPVTHLDDDEVMSALDGMRGKNLAREVAMSGSRVPKYRHTARETLDISAPEMVVLAELLLRGPQTVGELRGRAARMHPLESLEIVQNVLDSMMRREEPLVRELPPAPGTRANRYGQLLCHTLHPLDPPRSAAVLSAPDHELPAATHSTTSSGGIDPRISDLVDRVEALEHDVAQLKSALRTITQALGHPNISSID